jgi:hypothetical protein
MKEIIKVNSEGMIQVSEEEINKEKKKEPKNQEGELDTGLD